MLYPVLDVEKMDDIDVDLDDPDEEDEDDYEEEDDSEEEDNGAITPFTETTVNLPEMPITPDDDVKPTFDHYNGQR